MKTRATAYPVWNAFLPAPDSPLPLREQLLRFLRKGVAEGSLAAACPPRACWRRSWGCRA
jgi:GntR family transcriptional regulator/MocR family aminotransferase